jgi:hypothetical protein
MLRALIGAVGGLIMFAGRAPAFEVEATIKKVDADKRLLVVHARGQDRRLTIPKEARILNAEGKPMADGLKAKELKEGALIKITAERVDDKPVIRAIQLIKNGGKAAPPDDRPAPIETSKLKALTDMGKDDQYMGFAGGLYPHSQSKRPANHEAAGVALAAKIRPLDKDGKPSADGKIVLLGIGFSNTVQAFAGFMQVAQADKEINPRVVLVNGARGGMSAFHIQNPDDKASGTTYWTSVDDKLKAAGVTRAQVQVIWIKETNPAPHQGAFPKYIQTLQAELTRIVQILPKRFPNVKLVYLSSRTYGGWARGRGGRGPGNSEPYSYETGFAVKWLIEQQLKGDAALNIDATKGPVKAPWLSWGPYLWANGTVKRADGFSSELKDFREDDRMHESPAGQKKVGTLLLNFFKTDPTTKGWFNKPNP